MSAPKKDGESNYHGPLWFLEAPPPPARPGFPLLQLSVLNLSKPSDGFIHLKERMLKAGLMFSNA